MFPVFNRDCICFTKEGNGNPLQCSCLENPRMGEPGGLPSTGSHRVGHDWSDLAAAAAVFALSVCVNFYKSTFFHFMGYHFVITQSFYLIWGGELLITGFRIKIWIQSWTKSSSFSRAAKKNLIHILCWLAYRTLGMKGPSGQNSYVMHPGRGQLY